MKKWIFLWVLTATSNTWSQKTPITIESLDSLVAVGDPRLSPEGSWVAYTLTSVNHENDQYSTDLWMVDWEGKHTVQLTHTPDEDETNPRWSPDGRYLAFLSARKPASNRPARSQIWLLHRLGGEAQPLTSFPGGVDDFAWSPDGTKLAVIVNETDTVEYIEGTQTPKPIVIERFYFKEDYTGYLTHDRRRLYVFDLNTRSAFRLLDGDYEEHLPVWSPDGRHIAFVSKRNSADWDRDDNYDVYTAEAKEGAVPVRITHTPGADCHPDYGSYPAWSPDGKWIAYSLGGPPKLIYYGTQHLAIAARDGSSYRVLTTQYDRNCWQPRFSVDGSLIYFLAEDDQNLWLSKTRADGGIIEREIQGRYTIAAYDIQKERIVVLYSTSDKPYELYAVENGQLRPLTRHNSEWVAKHIIHPTFEFSARSKDGTPVRGHYVLPADYVPGKRYPCVLQIHGGPAAQNQNEWYEDWQLYASWGYVLVSMNPRGSTGFGQKFATALFARWGSVDLEDNLAGIDYLIRQGIVDPERLAVEGWSYGGIATNFLIAKDQRFRCAISGSSLGNALAGFGTDQYIREYLLELGTPWDNIKNYLANSYPFLNAHKIKTPTLFMCGEKDFNVPLLHSEQMYQALKTLGVETQLVIYPNQYHGLDIPSYVRDRYQRRKDWLDRFMH